MSEICMMFEKCEVCMRSVSEEGENEAKDKSEKEAERERRVGKEGDAECMQGKTMDG